MIGVEAFLPGSLGLVLVLERRVSVCNIFCEVNKYKFWDVLDKKLCLIYWK